MRAPKSDRIAQRGVALAMGAFEALGFAFRVQHDEDYGVDAHAELIEDERPTGRLLGIQLKSGPSYFKESQGDSYVFRVDSQHVEYWFDHCLPVLICLCDVDAGQVYWQAVDAETATSTGKGFKILIPMSQKLDSNSEANLRNLLTPMVAREPIYDFRAVRRESRKRQAVLLQGGYQRRRQQIGDSVHRAAGDGRRCQEGVQPQSPCRGTLGGLRSPGRLDFHLSECRGSRKEQPHLPEPLDPPRLAGKRPAVKPTRRKYW